MKRLFFVALLVSFAVLDSSVQAQDKKDPLRIQVLVQKVKATAVATKSDADGTQVVTVTLEIAKGLHLYANPVGYEFLEDRAVTVKITAKEKVKYVVMYPVGKTVGWKDEKFNIYEGIVKLTAHVARTRDDASALTIHIEIWGSSDSV